MIEQAIQDTRSPNAEPLFFKRNGTGSFSSWLERYQISIGTILAIIIFAVFLVVLLEYKLVLFFDFTKSASLWFWKIYSIFSGVFLLSRLVIVLFYEDRHVSYAASDYPSVSFVITAKNEEKAIFRTIEACMNSRYPGFFECIVVDDGSSDDTAVCIHEAQKLYEKMNGGVKTLSFEKNRGKREAMYQGLQVSVGEIIVFVDSDSFVDENALKIITEHFIKNDKVGAVSGNTGVENKNKNLLTKMQSARYGVSYDIFKACESIFGVVSCCAGCFSAYRRSAVLPIIDRWRGQKFLGTKSTYGDDRSLTNFVLRDWDVEYCSEAKATTIVPERYGVFFRQQLRWKKSWIREGTVASKFMWRKHPVASVSYYTNLLLPILGPVIALNALFISPIIYRVAPIVFVGGIIGMSCLFGIFYYIKSKNKYWPYLVWFSLLYVFIIVWQMPYALVRLRDTKWGTR
jgi:hyaluronan synthase